MNRSKLIAERYIECSNNGELNYSDELNVLTYLAKKFNLTTKSKLAKERGVSPSAITKSISNNREMVIELNGTELICN